MSIFAVTTYEWNSLFGACREDRGLKPSEDHLLRFVFALRVIIVPILC